MKVSASKKTIVILVLGFMLLILSALAFLFRDVILNGMKYGRWFLIDKNEELLDDCYYQKNNKELKIECNSFLYPPTEFEKETQYHCYNFIIIPKENDKKTYMKNMCVNNSEVEWENIDSWFSSEKILPVKVIYVYEKTGLFNYKYSKLVIKNATEQELHEIFSQNEDGKNYIPKVKTSYVNTDIYHNYVCIDSGIFEFSEIGEIYILDSELLNKEILDDEIHLTVKTKIKEKEVVFTIFTTTALLAQGKNNYKSEVMTALNSEELKVNQNLQLKIFYLNEKSDSFIQEITDICDKNSVPISIVPLCGNRRIISQQEFLPTSKDEIINELLKGGTTIELKNAIAYVIIYD